MGRHHDVGLNGMSCNNLMIVKRVGDQLGLLRHRLAWPWVRIQKHLLRPWEKQCVQNRSERNYFLTRHCNCISPNRIEPLNLCFRLSSCWLAPPATESVSVDRVSQSVSPNSQFYIYEAIATHKATGSDTPALAVQHKQTLGQVHSNENDHNAYHVTFQNK